MSTESDVKLERYKKVEKEVDAFNRQIGVRRLKPSEQTKIAGMTADLTGHDDVVTGDGVTVHVSHRLPLMIAAAVCWIDDSPIPFPKNRGELDAIFDRLDAEGMAAASRAIVRLNTDEEVLDKADAKN